MKLILSIILLTSCATRQINNKQQTFTEYVILEEPVILESVKKFMEKYL